MIKKIIDYSKKIRSNRRLEPILDTALFMIITLAIHFTYNYWAIHFNNRIFGVQILTPELFDWSTEHVFRHTRSVVEWILPVEIVDRTFYFNNLCSVTIVPSCSGIKQTLQFVLLLLIYPGPWKHKAWFIPMGIVAIHLTNIFRLSGLCVVMANWPQHWQFSHDYPARIVFYVVIFTLWVIWNDKFYRGKVRVTRK